MKRLRVDQITEALPELEELRPVLDHLMATSIPDPERTWTTSGELGTVGERLVDPGALDDEAERLAREVRDHLAAVYREVAATVRALEEDDRAEAARALLRVVDLEEGLSRPDRAERYALAAYGLSRGLRDAVPGTQALIRAARAGRAQGKLREALDRYRDAHEIARDSFQRRAAARAAIGAGNVLEDQARWERAEEWYRKALEVLGPESGAVAERWHACLNIHITLRFRGRIDESVPWLDEAGEVAAALGDEGARPYLENARGQLHMARGEFEEAEGRLREALAAAEDPTARVTIGGNLAETLLARGRVLDAAEVAREAERHAIVSGVVPRLPEVYRILGRIAAGQGNPEAFVLFERAIRIVRDRRLPPFEEALTLQSYAEFEEGRGEEETARELRERATEIYDELGIEHPRSRWADLIRDDPDERSTAEEPSTDE